MTVTFEQLLGGLEKVRRTGQNQWRSGPQFEACCPAHPDRHPSFALTVHQGQVWLHCHRRCEFTAIVAELERRGLWPVSIAPVKAAQPQAPVDRVPVALEPGLFERIRKIDAKLRAIDNTRVDRYLSNRGIEVRSPDQIAYHPALYHPFTGTWWPAMVAIIRTVEGHVAGLHRSYLSYAEPISKASIDPVRATLGPVTGHAIHLSPPAEEMLIGEGVETVLSAMQLYRLPGWAAISAGNLPRLILPPIVAKVIILVDDDEFGTGEEMAIRAAWRLRREGRRVELIKPEGCKDFNDLLRQQKEGIEQS